MTQQPLPFGKPKPSPLAAFNRVRAQQLEVARRIASDDQQCEALKLWSALVIANESEVHHADRNDEI